jgi:hypothetical protein
MTTQFSLRLVALGAAKANTNADGGKVPENDPETSFD